MLFSHWKTTGIHFKMKIKMCFCGLCSLKISTFWGYNPKNMIDMQVEKPVRSRPNLF